MSQIKIDRMPDKSLQVLDAAASTYDLTNKIKIIFSFKY